MPDETSPANSAAASPASASASPQRTPKLESLLAAAATTFATRGYSGTSMRDIAHDSGISLSGIYYYTRGKSSLLYEIQSRTIDALIASASSAHMAKVVADVQLQDDSLDTLVRAMRELRATGVTMSDIALLEGGPVVALNSPQDSRCVIS